MKYGLLFLLIMIFRLLPAQTDSSTKTRVLPGLEAGVLAGGQVASGVFIYRAAKSVEASLSFSKTDKILLGGGMGAEFYNSETYLPVFLHFKGFTRDKKNSGFFTAQGGYGFLASRRTAPLENFSSRGGIFFSPGIGYKIGMKKSMVLMSLSYKHQFSQLVYRPFEGEEYRNESNLHLVAFKIGYVLE